MQETVFASQVDSLEKLKAVIADQFAKGKYDDIARSIGMFSIFIDPQHMIDEQNRLYRHVFDLMKHKIASAKGKAYASWIIEFPKLLSGLVASKDAALDESSRDVIASHEAAYGPFPSLDHFFFWALDDRRLSLSQIMRCLERSAEMYKG